MKLGNQESTSLDYKQLRVSLPNKFSTLLEEIKRRKLKLQKCILKLMETLVLVSRKIETIIGLLTRLPIDLDMGSNVF